MDSIFTIDKRRSFVDVLDQNLFDFKHKYNGTIENKRNSLLKIIHVVMVGPGWVRLTRKLTWPAPLFVIIKNIDISDAKSVFNAFRNTEIAKSSIRKIVIY